MNNLKKTPLQYLETNFEKPIHLYIKRDDLIHPLIAGNKWRKLKYNILEMEKRQKSALLTFGGAFSNHIHAVAAAGKTFGFKTIGIIRGEPTLPLNPTLAYAKNAGMLLEYIDRSTYKKRHNPLFINELKQKYDNPYLLPEGGTNELAIKGCAEIVEEIDIPYDYISTACGTGGTLGGLILNNNNIGKILGFSVLKSKDFFTSTIQNLLPNNKQSNLKSLTVLLDYHFGGYAKFNIELIDFINNFKSNYDIQLDPIYTGKMMYGIFDLAQKGFFEENATIIALHTGGLQGIEGFKERFGDILN